MDEKVSRNDCSATAFTSSSHPLPTQRASPSCFSSIRPSMPSLFSRSRTNSTPNKNYNDSTTNIGSGPGGSGGLDEFGRATSRQSNNRGGASTLGGGVKGSKDKDAKKRDKEREKRLRTLSTPRDRAEFDQQIAEESALSEIPDGSFLPLNLERPWDELTDTERPKQTDYGYLSYERHVILGLEQVARLVDVVADEIGTRGLTTPFIFSTLAMDISAPAIKRLILTFLQTCKDPSSDDAERRWREEARFSGPHELGTCLRWGLARVVRIVGGQEVRGLLSWDHYLEFKDSEAALNYPPAHFSTFLPDLPPILQSTLLTLLSLLTRLTAHSASSGHTPPTLSPLFGPLLYGLGPATLAFHHTYMHYLRAVNGMEHILLAFIRWQDAPRHAFDSSINVNNIHGSSTALGVPTRLKDWIRGYPAMLPFLHEKNKNKRPQARRGVRTVQVVSVRRNVRMYSPDLVKTAASWAQRPRLTSSASMTVSDRGLATSKEWGRVAPPSLKLPPRYSEGYKKRMDLPPSFHPDTGASISAVPSNASSTNSSATSTLLDDRDYFGLNGNSLTGREGEDRFRSLTDLKWGEFESMGFGGLGDEKKLQFDLTESARTSRAAKRSTLSWNDFSDSGFSRTDAPLNATLQFSTPLATTISSWPTHQAEIHKKLKKTQKSLPAFGWDTEPVVGSEEVIEEAFVDVFCDLVYGGGWMDMERVEELDRECNWALIEFKSLPVGSMTAPGGSDPRTSNTLMLFEEFVPLEYRQQLAETNTTRRKLPSLFSPSNRSKQWKPAPTLNGRPYVVGHVPPSPSYREVEFEGLLRGNNSATKVISLSKQRNPNTPRISTSTVIPDRAATPRPPVPAMPASPAPPLPRQGPPMAPMSPARQTTSRDSDAPMTPQSKRTSRFRLPGGIPVPSPGGGRKSGMVPAESSTIDFETRLASYSDDELGGGGGASGNKHGSRDDAWVDILVATHSRRMGGQEAELRKPGDRGRGLKAGRSEPHLPDPEAASMEVAQALAGVRERSPPSDEELDERYMQPISGFRDSDYDGFDDTLPEPGADPHDESTQELEQDPDVDSIMSHPRRRMGYFDLHPERRPGRKSDEEDPRARLAEANSDDEGDGSSDGPDPSKADASAIQEAPHIEVPEFDNNEEQRLRKESAHSRAESTTLPPQIIQPPKRTASKTAALIEMYREKERDTTKPQVSPISPASPLPSKLPVRSSSLLPKDVPSIPDAASASIAPPATTSPKPSIPEPEPEAALDLDEPPRVILDETGRASPARYVHGAPLHNVLEEEEEQ